LYHEHWWLSRGKGPKLVASLRRRPG